MKFKTCHSVGIIAMVYEQRISIKVSWSKECGIGCFGKLESFILWIQIPPNTDRRLAKVNLEDSVVSEEKQKAPSIITFPCPRVLIHELLCSKLIHRFGSCRILLEWLGAPREADENDDGYICQQVPYHLGKVFAPCHSKTSDF